MITSMTKYSFILLSGEQGKFLSNLQELGVVDITRSAKPVDDRSEAIVRRAEALKKTISYLEALPVGPAVASDDPVHDTARLREKSASVTERLAAARKERENRLPWGVYDLASVRQLENQGLKIRYYKSSKKAFSSEWTSLAPLQVISEDKGNVWFVTVSDDSDYRFPIAEIPAPSGSLEAIDKEIASLEAEAAGVKAELSGLKAYLPSLQEEYDGISGKLDIYLAEVGSTKAADNLICVYEGFAPTENDAELKTAFDKMDCYWMSSAATVEDRPPIELKNNKFVRIFQSLTDMYGRPEYDGFDPTPYISIFFMLFFAFCMGDMGYGIVLIIVGLFMKKMKGFASMSSIVTVLGVATTVIGFLFHTFFSIDLLAMSWVPEGLKSIMLPSKIMGFDGTMVLALVIGVIHLCIALLVKTYYATRNNGFMNSLSTWGWTLLIVGGVIVAAFAFGGVLDKAVTKWIVIVMGILSALGIYIFNTPGRNPLINVGSGLWDTYNMASGLLGDVLSYLRLYALGLAGGMLGAAFNSLGMMILGDGEFGLTWLFCGLILLIGHVLNLAMAALGAFVHPLRLNFLEFFKNSDYQGTGRIYRPLQKTNNN